MMSGGGRERGQLRAKKARAELEPPCNRGERQAGGGERERERTRKRRDHGAEWSVGASRRSQGDGGTAGGVRECLGGIPKARPHVGGSEGVSWDWRA